jgi:hypothetical protein
MLIGNAYTFDRRRTKQLARLASAFDVACLGVNSVQTFAAQARDQARVQLAEIILDLWREHRTTRYQFGRLPASWERKFLP